MGMSSRHSVATLAQKIGEAQFARLLVKPHYSCSNKVLDVGGDDVFGGLPLLRLFEGFLVNGEELRFRAVRRMA